MIGIMEDLFILENCHIIVKNPREIKINDHRVKLLNS